MASAYSKLERHVEMCLKDVLCMQTVHAARIEQANGNVRAGVIEERVLPDHKASLREKDAELQVCLPTAY